MTLASHAIAGAAVASFFPKNPVAAFVFGFLSHFVLDAVPHGHYTLRSRTHHPENPLSEDMPWGKNLFFDLVKIGADFLLGLGLGIVLFQNPGMPVNWVIILGAIAGMAPDALQFVYWKIRREPLISLQKFHIWMHTKKNFNAKPFIFAGVELSVIIFSVLLVGFFA